MGRLVFSLPFLFLEGPFCVDPNYLTPPPLSTHSLPIMNDAKPPPSIRLNRRQLIHPPPPLSPLPPLPALPAQRRVWQEAESPAKPAASELADRGLRTRRIGVEEATMFTFYDQLRQAAPGFEFTSADPVTIACRGVKSAQELELMRLACEATCDGYRPAFAS